MEKYFYILIGLLILFALFSCAFNSELNNSTGTAVTTTTITSTTTTTSISVAGDTVKLMFIHHSCGGYWLSSSSDAPGYGGNLGNTLNSNNYYVTESNYGWNAEPGDSIGTYTDTGDWPNWFNETKMPYVYSNNSHYVHTNSISDPGVENEVIMFKSCYPCSEVGGSIDDEKAVYNNLLTYFAAHTNKLFVLITPPGETVVESYLLTREICNWLVDEDMGWLSGYAHNNVFVFDFYCVLSETGSHHRVVDGSVEYLYDPSYDGTSPYHDGDDHPDSTGNQKASEEFISLLNYYYTRWKE